LKYKFYLNFRHWTLQ